jgi:hypothetical protein
MWNTVGNGGWGGWADYLSISNTYANKAGMHWHCVPLCAMAD